MLVVRAPRLETSIDPLSPKPETQALIAGITSPWASHAEQLRNCIAGLDNEVGFLAESPNLLLFII